MGLIRLLLALAVVGEHSTSHLLLKFTGGQVAVEAFFIISGFYMAMVYKDYDSKANFWKSRYLRLYPTYIFCALLSFVCLRGGWDAARGFLSNPNFPLAGKVFLAFTNLTIFLQDVTMFLSMDNGVLHFTKNFATSSPALYEFLWVGQGWSLGLELMFYFLVPFILGRSTKLIVGLIFLSIATKFVLQGVGLSADPWSYRFFPSELSLFLLGSVAFRIYTQSVGGIRNEHLRYLLFSAVVLYLVFFPFVPLDYQPRKLLFYLLFVSSLGVVFDLTKGSRIDNFIGMLSYPIYCVHFVVLGYVAPKIKWLHQNGEFLDTAGNYLLIALLSALIYVIIEKPIDVFRKKYKGKKIAVEDATLHT